jgi:uncharacterized membrane protein
MVDALTIRAARSSPTTWLHAGGNAAMLAIGILEWTRRRRATPLAASEVWPSVTAVMVGILTVTGWLGGELAYRKGIGVNLGDGDLGDPSGMGATAVEAPALPGGTDPAEGRTDITPA